MRAWFRRRRGGGLKGTMSRDEETNEMLIRSLKNLAGLVGESKERYWSDRLRLTCAMGIEQTFVASSVVQQTLSSSSV